MATAAKDVLSDTDSEFEPLLASNILERRNSRPGYEQRKRVMEAGNFVVSDHGTFLGMRMNSVIQLQIPDEADIPPMDNPTTIALNICQERVLKPFNRLMKFVGWQPIFEDADRSWKKFLNVLHPLLVVVLILMGYLIQYASCFRRDKAYFSADIELVTISPANVSRNHTGSKWPPCQHYIISQYMIPDILHSVAYIFSFYTVRIKQSEQLPTLIVRVFLQTSPTETGFRSQGNLIRKLRRLLYGSLVWVFLSQVAQAMHIGAQYFQINFYWLDPGRSEEGRVMLLVLMCISFIALDIVYIVVVLNYCVQCCLLIFYIEGIMEKIRESRRKLMPVMKEISEMQSHIRVLNHNPGIALSIVMINFGTMGALGFIAIIQQKGEENALMYVATFFAFLLWLAVMALPIIVGSMLTAACNSLRKMGHEIRVRPFGYESDNITDEELNGFLLFLSSLRLKPLNNNKNVGGTKRGLEENGPENKSRRAAFGDLTNANAMKKDGGVAKITKKVVKKEGGKKKTVMTVAVPKVTKNQISSSQPLSNEKEKPEMSNSQPERDVSFDYVELSQGSQLSRNSSQSSLSSSQGSLSSTQTSLNGDETTDYVTEMNEKNNVASQDVEPQEEKKDEPEQDWVDVDAEHMKDPLQCGLYSAFIFQYYKDREAQFAIGDYLQTKQKDLTPNMRAILVDWLVDVQENFKLNHETLYLAVKLVDRYLCLDILPRDRLQLLGVTCLFIACKFDEGCPPVLDDFLYICDDAYRREELIRMEMKVLRTIGFDLGIPLSYRFLRRYAECARVAMDSLTLGRYILETSLMHYKFAQKLDSHMAAASLLLAMTMKNTGSWDGTMRHYTGYEESDILETVAELNKMIMAPPSKHLMTIRSKYSHAVFHKVALIAPLTESQLNELGCPALSQSSSEKSSIIKGES